jgi:hypothetical protein
MSWEVMQTRTGPCGCGAGTETCTLEVDDWNRTRNSTEIHCRLALSNENNSLRQIKTVKNGGRGSWVELDNSCQTDIARDGLTCSPG